MDEQQRQGYESQSQELRLELKRWENDWAKAHGGSKPARNDIKENPDIGMLPFTSRLRTGPRH